MSFRFHSRIFGCFLLLTLPTQAQAQEMIFPKLTDAKRIKGELVSADFIHRSGQFRSDKGELMEFSLLPYGVMKYRGAESDLRDVPLGTRLDFLLLPDADGKLTRLLTTEDGQSPDPEQLNKFREFTEKRGVAGWVDKTDAKTVTITLFSGDPVAYEAAYGALLAKGKDTNLCVSNDELRTWNPGVDGRKGSILELKKVPTDGFGSSGYQITVSVPTMLEGYRRGRIVRIFLSGWKAQDQFYGESLMGYGFGRMQNQDLIENVAKEYPEQFPFRTDYGNRDMSWYQLKEGVKPPPFSEHLVFGELIRADAKSQSGEFRMSGSGDLVTFTVHKPAILKHLGKNARFENLPANQRYRFHLYEDDKGNFTRVASISDDFSHQTANQITYRILSIGPDALHLAWQLPDVKDYNGDMQRPPDIGRSIVPIKSDTRVWKDTTVIKLADLKVDDIVRFNQTAELPGKPGAALDIWKLEAAVLSGK